MISVFKNLKSTNPLEQIDVYEFFDRIKSPSIEIRNRIIVAREFKERGNKDAYSKMKELIPCFTLNFNFINGRKKENIHEATGLIYLDIDDTTNINLSNPFIFASWISLSGNGRGILVKVEGLNDDNFSETYEAIGDYLDLDVDKGAKKSTQPNIHSWDENIYINNDSSTWLIHEVKKNPTPLVHIKEEKKGTQGLGEIKYDNLHVIDFKGKDYLEFLGEKLPTAKLVIPYKIVEKNRNNQLSAIAYQLRALNPDINERRLKGFMKVINLSRCETPLKEKEINQICKKVLAIKQIKPILNSHRRIIFNLESDLSVKERRILTNQATGKAKRLKTYNHLKKLIYNWDFNTHNKITQKSLAKASGKHIKTIENYYKHLKEEIKELNLSHTKKAFTALICFLSVIKI